MTALQASTSYSVGFGISSFVTTTPRRCHHRHVILAKVEPTEKSVEIMRKFSEQYARRSGTYFCVDKSVTSVVIKGLADHKDALGAPLCPCRHYDDKAAEATQGFWNCPCVPMRERKECHCMLFLTTDNDFAGQEQKVVKRSWPTSGTDFQGFSSRKRSLSDRFERDADTSMSSSSKRLQMKDNPRNSGSTRVKGVGEKDLRLKLIRKRMPSGVKNDVEEPTRMEIRQNMSCNSRVPKAAEFTLRNGSPTKREAEFLMMDPLRYSSRPLGNSIPQFPDRALHAVRRIPAPRNTDEELQVSSTMPVQASRIRRLSNSDVLDPSMSIGVAPIMRRVTSDAGKPLTELSGEQPLTVSSLLHFLGLGKYAINFLAEEVDMTALKQMQDHDLKAIGLPMGPRKKILLAIAPSPKRQRQLPL